MTRTKEGEVEGDKKVTPGCIGCGGDCKDCEGNVPPARKGAGRPRKFCCYNCKQRAGSRAFYRREYKTHENDEREVRKGDFRRIAEGHKTKGHDGKPCPAPWLGDKNTCPVLAQIFDNQREVDGLEPYTLNMDIINGL